MPRSDPRAAGVEPVVQPETPTRPSRRRVVAMALAALATPRPARALPAAPPLNRLRLINAHTGETFDGPYRDGNGPIPAAMADLSAFLRDFHCGAEIPYDVRALDFLAAVMAAVGQDSATILSAYRTPATNAMLARTTFGVAEHSQHMYGRALDISFPSKLEEAMTAARAMQRGGVGWYPGSHFIHLDSGPVRNWELDERGVDRLLVSNGGGLEATAPRRATTAIRRASIGGGSGELYPAVAARHPSLTTRQLLANFRASQG